LTTFQQLSLILSRKTPQNRARKSHFRTLGAPENFDAFDSDPAAWIAAHTTSNGPLDKFANARLNSFPRHVLSEEFFDFCVRVLPLLGAEIPVAATPDCDQLVRYSRFLQQILQANRVLVRH
jgi:hypothetical protein